MTAKRTIIHLKAVIQAVIIFNLTRECNWNQKGSQRLKSWVKTCKVFSPDVISNGKNPSNFVMRYFNPVLKSYSSFKHTLVTVTPERQK